MTEQAVRTETVDYSVAEGVAWIRLNRPERMNAIDQQTRHALAGAIRQAERDPEVRCVVLVGAGDRAFCSGADVKEMASASSEMRNPESVGRVLRDEYAPMITRLYSMPKPVIAAMNGVAAGIGASFAMAADIRLAVPHAAIVEAFVGIGLMGDGGATWFLPRLVGRGKALEMLMLGSPVGAEEAERLGLVNKVIPAAEFEATVRDWARRLASGPTMAIAANKRAVNYGLGATLEEGIEFEAHLQEVQVAGEDSREGVAAFAEKREPRFQGR